LGKLEVEITLAVEKIGGKSREPEMPQHQGAHLSVQSCYRSNRGKSREPEMIVGRRMKLIAKA